MLKQQVNSFFVIISNRVFTATISTFIFKWNITSFHVAIFTPSKNTMYVLANKFLLPSTAGNNRFIQCGFPAPK